MRSSPLITRVSPVTVNVALERMSSELLPALGIVKLFGNACGAVDVSGPAGKR